MIPHAKRPPKAVCAVYTVYPTVYAAYADAIHFSPRADSFSAFSLPRLRMTHAANLLKRFIAAQPPCRFIFSFFFPSFSSCLSVIAGVVAAEKRAA